MRSLRSRQRLYVTCSMFLCRCICARTKANGQSDADMSLLFSSFPDARFDPFVSFPGFKSWAGIGRFCCLTPPLRLLSVLERWSNRSLLKFRGGHLQFCKQSVDNRPVASSHSSKYRPRDWSHPSIVSHAKSCVISIRTLVSVISKISSSQRAYIHRLLSNPLHCQLILQLSFGPLLLKIRAMCDIHYTLHSCGHWIPQPQPNNGPILRLCKTAEHNRLGSPCPISQRRHEVMNRSQGMCQRCLWKKVSK